MEAVRLESQWMSCSSTSWPEGLCSLSKRMETRMSHVPCFLLLSHQEDEDTQKEESWTTDSNLAGDLWRTKPLTMKWGSGIHCSSFSVGLWTKFWRASAWECLYQFICFEAFLPAYITCFVFFLEWNTNKTCLPAIPTALQMSHWPTPWLWAASSLAISVAPSEKQGNELRFADNEKVNMNGIVPRK